MDNERIYLFFFAFLFVELSLQTLTFNPHQALDLQSFQIYEGLCRTLYHTIVIKSIPFLDNGYGSWGQCLSVRSDHICLHPVAAAVFTPEFIYFAYISIPLQIGHIFFIILDHGMSGQKYVSAFLEANNNLLSKICWNELKRLAQTEGKSIEQVERWWRDGDAKFL